MLLRVTKICSGRLEAVQNSQICDLAAVTFIMPMPVERGQAGGGVEFLTKMTPLPLAKIPATQVAPPQDAKARHANTTTALRNVFRILRGRNRMGLLQTALPNHARMEILREILCLCGVWHKKGDFHHFHPCPPDQFG